MLLADATCIRPKPTKTISTNDSHNMCERPKKISALPSIAVAICSMRVSPTADLRTASESAEVSAPTPDAPMSQPSVCAPPCNTCAGKDRHQHGVGIAHQTGKRKQEKDAPDRTKCSHIVPAFAYLLQHGGSIAADLHGLDVHHQQRGDHGKIAEAIQQKTPAFADGRNHQAGNSRTNQARAIRHGRIDGDGITEIAAVFHHLHQKRLAAGHVKGIDQALHGGESNDLPQIDDMRQRKRSQAPVIGRRQAPASRPEACGD